MDSGHRGEGFFPAEEPHDTRGVKGEGHIVEWGIDEHPRTLDIAPWLHCATKILSNLICIAQFL
jgi:hypothetical protein